MLTLFRWLIRIAAVFVGLSVLGVFAVYYLASRSLPDYNQTVEVLFTDSSCARSA